MTAETKQKPAFNNTKSPIAIAVGSNTNRLTEAKDKIAASAPGYKPSQNETCITPKNNSKNAARSPITGM
ncbi:hypothetical protein [Methylomonas methanica]|uniref:hypothetical protein n=1 Tax=Methylomonas methanica TaxID=421 RepID=UPI001FB2686E|nr:hypothetical protein [Methylomonas methanica]